MKIETRTQRLHVIELTDDDVARLRESPKEVEALLIQLNPAARLLSNEKNRIGKQSVARLSLKEKALIARQLKAVRAKAEKKNKRAIVTRPAPELFACRKPGCDREFKKEGFRDRHEESCTAGQGEPD
jgi:hypothetical protein